MKRAAESPAVSEDIEDSAPDACGLKRQSTVCAALYDELLRQELVRRCIAPQVSQQVAEALGLQDEWLRVAVAVETALCQVLGQTSHEFVTTRGLRVQLQLEVTEVKTEVPSTPVYEH